MVIESRDRTADGSGGVSNLSSATSMNAGSGANSGAVRVSCLNLVDLAGSERVGYAYFQYSMSVLKLNIVIGTPVRRASG